MLPAILRYDHLKSDRRKQADADALVHLRKHPSMRHGHLINWLYWHKAYPERIAAAAARWAFAKLEHEKSQP